MQSPPHKTRVKRLWETSLHYVQKLTLHFMTQTHPSPLTPTTRVCMCLSTLSWVHLKRNESVFVHLLSLEKTSRQQKHFGLDTSQTRKSNKIQKKREIRRHAVSQNGTSLWKCFEGIFAAKLMIVRSYLRTKE